jgi:hypothetical protein
MARQPQQKNAANTRGRPFPAGNSGRPQGARNKKTLAAEILLEGQARALTRRAVQAALGGDMTAMRLCLERISPVRREAAIRVDIPPVNSAADVPAAISAIVSAVAAGNLTVGQGESMVALLDRCRAVYQATESERQGAEFDRVLRG